MIITRKIQIEIDEDDKELRKEHLSKLYDWRRLVLNAANIIVSHKFCQDNIRNFVYIKDEIKEKFYVSDILKDEKGMSERNVTYRVLTEMLKGKVPSDIYAALNQNVGNSYKETKVDVLTGKTSLRSYKKNIPVPFSSKAISNIHWNSEKKQFVFSLFGIPLRTFLGADRSNNKVMLERAISGEYKLCSSAYTMDDKKNKTFLLICLDIPKKNVSLSDKKVTYANLSLDYPIEYFNSKPDIDLSQCGEIKKIRIGDKNEFLYQRLQMQAALKRMQIAAKYNKGGKGRKRKLQSIERFEAKEKNYVNTKLHTYSKILVEAARHNGSNKIILLNQENKEDDAKDDIFVLRNWSYYGLIEKLTYKANLYGIKIEKIDI